MVHYEWCCELVDAHGDVVDLMHCDTFAAAALRTQTPHAADYHYCVALHRHHDDDGYRVTTYAYALTADGDYWRGVGDARSGPALDATCSIDGSCQTATPKRFLDEVRRYVAADGERATR